MSSKAKRKNSSPPGAKPAQPTSAPWHWAPRACAALFVILASGAAWVETPTIDEFAHVPAGMAHWRYGQLHAYPQNPPLGKMWVAAPLALDASVHLEPYPPALDGWQPWNYGALLQQLNFERYLALIFRARLMVIPLVLLTAWLIYCWSFALFGAFPAAMAASLFLLSPTLLAHGHVATVDVASMASIFAAMFSLRWALQAGNWLRDLVAGALLGVALLVKFSALFLLFVAPALILAAVWLKTPRDSLRAALRRLVIYLLVCWLTVNMLMGFSNTFAALGRHRFESRSMQRIASALPQWMPSLLPREYLLGLDVLQWEVESQHFPGYLAGKWSTTGWKVYYPAAFAMKETEPVVLLVLVALAAIWFAKIERWDVLLLVAPPAAFLFIVIFLNSLSLGIRYILPAFPFAFVMAGSCFVLAERWLQRPTTHGNRSAFQDRRLWLASGLLAYCASLMIAVFPSYLSYFNAFVGGSAEGPNWLLDSNYDWGQDLYRLTPLAPESTQAPLRLLYFGEVNPALYSVQSNPIGSSPDPALYAVSANLWYGANYRDRVAPAWVRQLEPTDHLGSIMLFDLRLPSDLHTGSPTNLHNWGIVALERAEFVAATQYLFQALRLEPQRPRTRVAYARALEAIGNLRAAIQEYRSALQELPDHAMAMNNLAWLLATHNDPSLRDPAEAVRLAQRACELTQRENLQFLDTLATALAADDQIEEARQVAREGLQRAETTGQAQIAEQFQELLQRLH